MKYSIYKLIVCVAITPVYAYGAEKGKAVQESTTTTTTPPLINTMAFSLTSFYRGLKDTIFLYWEGSPSLLKTLNQGNGVTSVAYSPAATTTTTTMANTTDCSFNDLSLELKKYIVSLSIKSSLCYNFECSKVLQGHIREITLVAFSLNGKTIITGSKDKTARLWNAHTGDLLHTLQGHTSWITSVAFSPNSKTVITGSRDNTARLWTKCY